MLIFTNKITRSARLLPLHHGMCDIPQRGTKLIKISETPKEMGRIFKNIFDLDLKNGKSNK